MPQIHSSWFFTIGFIIPWVLWRPLKLRTKQLANQLRWQNPGPPNPQQTILNNNFAFESHTSSKTYFTAEPKVGPPKYISKLGFKSMGAFYDDKTMKQMMDKTKKPTSQQTNTLVKQLSFHQTFWIAWWLFVCLLNCLGPWPEECPVSFESWLMLTKCC